MANFPLCKQAKLGIYKNARWDSPCGTMGTQQDMIGAPQVEALLAKAPVVYGQQCYLGGSSWFSFSDPQGRQNTAKGHEDTHTARLIMIEPIPRDTAESLLQQLVLASKDTLTVDPKVWHIIERAKALLEQK